MVGTCDQLDYSSIIYDVQIPKPFIYGYLVANTVLCLLIIATNSILIHAIRRLGKLKIVSFQFILYLSISDLFVGIVQLPLQFSIVSPQPESIDTKTLCSQFAIYFVSQMSAGMTIILAIDRYIHMKYLSRWNEIVTKRRAVIVTTGCTIMNLITTGILILSTVYRFYFFFKCIYLPTCLMVLIYLSIIYIQTYNYIRRRVRSMKMHNANTAKSTTIRNPEHEFAKLMISVIACLIICYLPSIIFSIIKTIVIKHGCVNDYLKYAILWSYTMTYVNSMTNAVIIICGNKQVKSFVIGMFTGTPNQSRQE